VQTVIEQSKRKLSTQRFLEGLNDDFKALRENETGLAG